MARRHDAVGPALLAATVVVVLAGALGAVPALSTRPVPRAEPTAAQAVAHLERTWRRVGALPGPAAFTRRPGAAATDDCGIGRVGGPVADDGRRVLAWVSADVGPEALSLLVQVRRALVASGLAPRPSAGSGEALGDLDGYAWLLRVQGARAEVLASTPCLQRRVT